MIFPANDNNETSEYISKIDIRRYQMDPMIDYNIHGRYPVIHVPVLKNFYKLSTKLCHNVNSLF